MYKIFNFLKIIILVLLFNLVPVYADNWYCGDFHVHARADSGGGPGVEDYHVTKMVDNAKRLGFDFLCFTDHSNRSSKGINTESKWNKVKEKYKNASSSDLIVIPGVEVSDVVGEEYGKGAHINAISIEKFYQGNTPQSSEFEEKKDSPEAVTTEYVINNVYEEGGITTLNHPYVSEKEGDKIFWEKLITDKTHITCIEDRYWTEEGENNFYHDPKTVAYLYPKWNQGIKIWINGSSDAHYDPDNVEWNPELGKEFTVVYAASKSKEAIISAIKKGRMYIVYNSEDYDDKDSRPEGKEGMPTLELFSISDGDKEVILGDTLITTKKEVQIKIKVTAKREIYRIRITKDSNISFKKIDPKGNSFETTFDDRVDTGLHWYTVDVRAKGGDLILSNPIFVKVEESTINFPTAPNNLQGYILSPTSVKIIWSDNSDNEDGFKIERKEKGGTFREVAKVGKDVTVYEDKGLVSNKTYVYKVCAYNSRGDSGYSNEILVALESTRAIWHYPNPLKYNDNKYNNIITFVNIPDNEEIKIYNRAGELVKTINEDLNNPNNERKWNLKNDAGNIVSSDVYFYVVRREDKKYYVGKIVVIK